MSLTRIKKIVVSVIGFTVLIIGILLIVLPGPAFIVIPIGLAILANEYVWANNLLKKVKEGIRKTFNKQTIGKYLRTKNW